MKICHVTGGRTAVPPREWYWIEDGVWALRHWGRLLGADVHIVNSSSTKEVIGEISRISPDVLHIHADRHFQVSMTHRDCVRILQSYTPDLYNPSRYADLRKLFEVEGHICCSSPAAKEHLVRARVDAHRSFVTATGARTDLTQFDDTPRFPQRTLSLGPINKWSRHHLFVQNKSIDVIGPVRFEFQGGGPDMQRLKGMNYLGIWTHNQARQRMTEYASLVAIYERDIAPFITASALAAGLGLVISEAMACNINTELPFVTVVPEARIDDIDFLEKSIAENRSASIPRRRQIRQYAVSNFDWELLTKSYLENVTRLRCTGAAG